MSSKNRPKGLFILLVIALLFIPFVASYAETINYVYDDLNRLRVVDYGNGKWIEYVYDEVGNREEKVFIEDTSSTAPSNLMAAAISSSQINLSWTDNSTSESGFKIERKTGVSGIYTQIATVSANATTYSDTGLTAETTYYYRAKAYYAVDSVYYSNEDDATTMTLPTATTNPATNVGDTIATLNAIVNPRGLETTVYFEWWTDINNKNNTAPQSIGNGTNNVSVIANLTGLLPNTIYYYRVAAINAGGTNYGSDMSFTTQNWGNNTWPYRQRTTISRAITPANLTDFPMLVKITDQTNPVFDRAQTNGYDIFFTLSDGVTKLNHEIEKYVNTPGSEELIAWVKIPTLLSSADTIIYMYYGNGSASNQQNPIAVWDSDYKAVWHLKQDETSGLYPDSTSNNNHGNDYVSATGKNGQVNGGQEFKEVNGDYVVTTTTQPNQSLGVKDRSTVEVWVNVRSFPSSSSDFKTVYEIYQPQTENTSATMLHYIYFNYANQGKPVAIISGVGTVPFSSAINLNEWTHLAVTYDDATDKFTTYINGVPNEVTISGTKIMSGSKFEVAIGICRVHPTVDNGGPFDGFIDELRISGVARSAEWIKASYNNQKDPATYLSFATEEIFNTSPTANAGGPYSGIEGQAITLDGSGSSDLEGPIALYEWDVNNDGIYEYSFALPTQNHTYVQQGTYTIKLRVTDNSGATNEATTTATITDTSPTANFTGSPTTGPAPLTVNFTNSSTGYDQPLSYQWDFDDNGSVDSPATNPSAIYTGQGIYSVKLTATDSDGSTNILRRTNYITVTPPVYTLTVTKSGTGTGTITSSPLGINCGADCTETYTEGTVVTLTATPDAGSTFTGWTGGGCSGTGNCVITMNADAGVTAVFEASSSLPVRIGNTYYSSLQAAYDAAGNGVTIQTQAVVFTENLNINRNISITLQGGYNVDYTAIIGKTSLQGQMTVSNGTVTAKEFVIKK